MSRLDLQALTPDDLVALSNRGNLNRATRDLESGQFEVTFAVQGDDVTVHWSDPATCVFPAGKTITDAYCSCPAIHLCRHIVRSVLAYQREHAAHDAVPSGPWDPGALTHAALSSIPSALLGKAQMLMEEGQVVELLRSEKPSARFHTLGHTVKFLVHGDVRYAHCDCAMTAPCVHAVASVLAFQKLPVHQSFGVVTTQDESPRENEHARRCEEMLERVAHQGFARVGEELVDRLRGAHEKLAADGWVWPADVVHEIAQAHAMYRAHDARFSAEDLAQLHGEFAIRLDALRAPRLHVPRSFVQGGLHDHDTRLGASRFVGLGCHAKMGRGHVDVMALLQDTGHGRVIAVTHRFVDPKDEAHPSLSDLGSRLVIRGRGLVHFGAGQIVMQQARLTSAHRLDLGRAQASIYAQGFKWEELPPPVLADGFAEIAARLGALAPPSLRSRRIGEDVYVCPIQSVEQVGFSERSQSVEAKLTAADGSTALLWFGYSSRNSDGCERMLSWLKRNPEGLKFVAGVFRPSAKGVVVEPTGLVFETHHPDGPRRELIQPWVDSLDAHLETATETVRVHERSTDALAQLRFDVASTLGEVLVQGLHEFSQWERLAEIASRAASLGLVGISTGFQRFEQQRDVSTLSDVTMLNALLQETR